MDNAELDFEKARYEHILLTYEGLKTRKDSIEKRAIFQLLIITLLLGLIFSNVNAIVKLNDYLMSVKDIRLLFFSNMLFFLLAVALVLALAFIIVVLFRSQTSETPPKDLVTSVYFSDGDSMQHRDPVFFYQRIGVAYSVIIDHFSGEVSRSDTFCRLATISLSVAVLILGMAIITFTLGIPVP